MKSLIVFDLDGTLAPSRTKPDEEMEGLLNELISKKKVAIISSGSWDQFQKRFISSLDESNFKNLFLLPNCSTLFFVYDKGWNEEYADVMSEEEKKKIFNGFKKAFRDVKFEHGDLFGELIEDRGTQITFSGLGQDAPNELKREWDPEREIRDKIKERLDKYIPEFEVHVSGSASIDITKKGVTKAQGITLLEKYMKISLKEMLFIGDEVYPGGNDYPVKEAGVECVQVSGPEETKDVIRSLL